MMAGSGLARRVFPRLSPKFWYEQDSHHHV
jgi:hypothetical protein